MIRVFLLSLIFLSLALPGQAGYRFDDHAPLVWTGRAPGSYAVHGLDVARFQDRIGWRETKRAGVEFVFIKATEGGDFFDPMFKDHWSGARRAGIPRGAYHFYYFCRPAKEQAAWFIQNVPRRRGTLPPVLDMEWNTHSLTCIKRPPPRKSAVRRGFS